MGDDERGTGRRALDWDDVDALATMEHEGRPISPDLIGSTAPLEREHIILTGDRIWPAGPVTGPCRFD